jgi:hypothetical protein
MLRSRIPFALFLLTGLFLGACEANDPEATFESAENNAQAENEFAQIFKFMDEQGRDYENGGSDKTARTSQLLTNCASKTVTPDPNDSSQFTVTIDFGDSCLCKDGVYRSGQIIGDFQGGYRQEGSTLEIALQNYQYNFQYSVEGTKTVVNEGNDSTGNYIYRTTVSGATITNDSTGNTITWNGNYLTERTQGDSTLNPLDDVYRTTGSASGVNVSGDDFTAEITEPLVRRMSCLAAGIGSRTKHYVQGVVTLDSGGNTLTLDYDPEGSANCDRLASIQFNDREPRNFTLR